MGKEPYAGVGSNPDRRERDPNTLAGDQTHLSDDFDIEGVSDNDENGESGTREKKRPKQEKPGDSPGRSKGTAG